MSLQKILHAYRHGEMDKTAYIEKMYAHHQVLHEYARFLRQTDLKALHLERGRVVAEWDYPPLRLSFPEAEMRSAPVEALNFGAYEKTEFALLDLLAGSFRERNPVVLDIGANIGFYSIGLQRLYPHLSLHAFEPVPATAESFAANRALNACDGLVLHRHGLSDTEKTATFHIHPQVSVAASEADILGGAEVGKIEVPLKTLDGIRHELPRPVRLIKCDIEGAELFAFKGARKLIAEDKPVIFSEMLRKWSAKFGYHPNDIIALCKDLGYTAFAIAEGTAAPVTEVTESMAATNFLFLHEQNHRQQRDLVLP
ncbi:MAG: FkbM family methyltransferase [Verrucomicrobia bacterium]|jgi:FkbM family methyltransferase|nr:FkbM family methyltransferase [Verrucomicrobiota bacterium]